MARAIPRQQSTVPGQQLIDSAIQLLKTGQHARAESRLATLRRQLPGNARVLALHGDALRQLDRLDDAIEAYQLARDTGLASPAVLLNQAYCHVRLKQGSQAMALARQLLDGQPENAAALGLMGDAWRLQHEPLKARDALRQALALQPDNARLYLAAAHLDTFTASSPVFGVLEQYLQDPGLGPSDRATAWATLGKAWLDTGNDARAFDCYARANQIMDASLPPIQAELERLLMFTRSQFTPSLFEALSPFGSQHCRQIIVAGMSRSGKSLVESLFRGVEGVRLAGEELLLSEYQAELVQPYGKRMDAWLAAQSPDSIASAAEGYANRLHQDDSIAITTIPGDLWNLGLIGLLAPTVPIIFCVRGVLDLGVTGFFQQYDIPSGYRYSYDLHHLGRQIACSEKVMEHWAQVLPNPVYLVDYEALVQDPLAVMGNLLEQLGLQRTQSYNDIVGANAQLLDTISPIVSTDAPMPITNRFVGLGERFSDRLQPLIDGYKTIVEQFPRYDPPATFPEPLPEVLFEGDDEAPLSDTTPFDWQLQGRLVAVDNGGQLIKADKDGGLLDLQAFELVVFDPAGEAMPSDALKQNPNLHYVPQALLGDGQEVALAATLDPLYSSTQTPLPDAQRPAHLRQPAMTLASLPATSHALDAIDGLNQLDWLVLDGRYNVQAVLDSGNQRLANCLLIQAGVYFQPLWQNQTSLAEITHWAARNGFRFYRLIGMEYAQAMPARTDLPHQPEASELLKASVLLLPDDTRLAAMDDASKLKLAFLLDTVYHIHDNCYSLLRQVGESLAENYLKARGYFDRRRGGPAHAELLRVRAAIEAGEGSGQLAQLSQWASRFADDPQVWRLLALLASHSGNTAGAIQHINRAIKLAPDELPLRVDGLKILLHAGMWWEADSMVKTLLARVPDNEELKHLAAEASALKPM